MRYLVDRPVSVGDLGTRDLITFLSDFGWNGGYVAACEATVATIYPQARVLHISHEIPVGDVSNGATILRRVAPLCPPSVHLAVVDPSVGTGRRPLALVAKRGDALVGPDNGLLLPAVEALGGLESTWLLEPEPLRARAGLTTTGISSTFHGRDVFAPAAALLAAGIDPSEFARPADPASLVRLPEPTWYRTPQGVIADVVEVDRFGNVGLAVRFDDLESGGSSLLVEVEGESLPEWNAILVQTFGQLKPGELGVLRDSWGHVSLALNGASAAELLSVERGMRIRIREEATV